MMSGMNVMAWILPARRWGLFTFLLLGTVSAQAEPSRYQQLQDELRRTRDSLHLAQEELAEKARKIEELEKALEEAERAARGTGKRKERKKKVVVSNQDPPRGKSKAEPESKKMAADSADAPFSRFSLVMPFENRSAVNYEAREVAVGKVLEAIEANSEVRFAIHGGADDTPYETTNLEIAENRVAFLVDFLSRSGIDRSRFIVGRNEITTGKPEPRRFVKITEIIE